MGGKSRERSISIQSGQACFDAIKKLDILHISLIQFHKSRQILKKLIPMLSLIVYMENLERMERFKKF